MSTRSVLEMRKGVQRLDNAKEKLEQVENAQKDLKEQLKYIQTEEYLEKALLEELNMVEPGERVLVLESAKSKDKIKEEEEAEQTANKSILQLWLAEFNLAKTQQR